MPGSYPLSSNNWNKGVGLIGPETARSSASNNLTVMWAALAYFSSAGSQRSELKSTSLEGFIRMANRRWVSPPNNGPFSLLDAIRGTSVHISVANVCSVRNNLGTLPNYPLLARLYSESPWVV